MEFGQSPFRTHGPSGSGPGCEGLTLEPHGEFPIGVRVFPGRKEKMGRVGGIELFPMRRPEHEGYSGKAGEHHERADR